MLDEGTKIQQTIWTKDENGKDLFVTGPTPALLTMQANPNKQDTHPANADPIAATLSTLPIPALKTGM